MRYLIIGGAGFIGVNAAARLAAAGHEVTILDNLSRRGTDTNRRWLQQEFPQVKFIKADICIDQAVLDQAVAAADVVYHFAGQVAVTTSVANPREDFMTNALGTFNVLEAARLAPQPPIVLFASTNKVYGGMEDVKIIDRGESYDYAELPAGIAEDHGLDFHSPYGCSKGAADQYVRDYQRIYGLRTVVLRQSCIYGPHQFGVEDQGWVAWFAIAAIYNRPITVYGDGKQVRDVLHVDDLLMAYDAAVANIERAAGKIYNIGGGRAHTLSLRQLLAHLGELRQQPIPFSTADWRPGDQPVYISDIAKAQRELEWTPRIDPVTGVGQLWSWIKDNRALFEEVGLI